MNIVVIGLGSMGRRRIRLLKEMYPDYRVFGIGRKAEKREDVKRQFGIDSFESIQDVDIPIDCVFVCTPPLSHASIIKECLLRKWNVFTELNLVDDGYQENIDLAEEQQCKLFLSSTFLYREEIRYVQSHVTEQKRWNYIYHIGQYLPDWHPWENYKNFFVGDAKTNGCREIMAIELPWLIKTFGEVKKTAALSDRITGLDIQYNDNFMIQLTHENGNKGVLVVDVVSPCAVRKFEAYTERAYITWDGTPESLFEFNTESDKLEQVQLFENTEHKEGYRAFIVENAYKNEIKEFISVVKGEKEPKYDFRDDLKTLKLIQEIGA